jgi:uncharacterized membrane protein YfcA
MLLTLDQLFGFAVAGTAVSLLLEFFPKLHTWFNALPDNKQRWVVLISGLGVVAGAFGLNCVAFLVELPWVCTGAGLKEAVSAYLVFIMTTQGTHLITPKKVS